MSQRWEKTRPGVAEKMKRENLFQEISDAFRQWPEIEQIIFSEAHRHGRFPESISRSFQLDAVEVSATLKQCDRRLHASLRNLQ